MKVQLTEKEEPVSLQVGDVLLVDGEKMKISEIQSRVDGASIFFRNPTEYK